MRIGIALGKLSYRSFKLLNQRPRQDEY